MVLNSFNFSLSTYIDNFVILTIWTVALLKDNK